MQFVPKILIMNALEKAQLRIQHEDRIPKLLEIGKSYHLAWSKGKYKKTKYKFISYRGNKVVMLSPKEKRLVIDVSDLRVSERTAIKNAKKRQKENNHRRKLNFI